MRKFYFVQVTSIPNVRSAAIRKSVYICAYIREKDNLVESTPLQNSKQATIFDEDDTVNNVLNQSCDSQQHNVLLVSICPVFLLIIIFKRHS